MIRTLMASAQDKSLHDTRNQLETDRYLSHSAVESTPSFQLQQRHCPEVPSSPCSAQRLHYRNRHFAPCFPLIYPIHDSVFQNFLPFLFFPQQKILQEM